MAVKLIGAPFGLVDNNNVSFGNITMTQFTAEETGNVTEIRVKVGGNVNVKVGIYADSGGEPAALLASNQVGQASTVGWNTIPMTSLAVIKDTVYWIAENSDASQVRFRNEGLEEVRFKVLAYGGAWPNPAGGGYNTTEATVAIAGWGNVGGARKRFHDFPPFFSVNFLLPIPLLVKSGNGGILA